MDPSILPRRKSDGAPPEELRGPLARFFGFIIRSLQSHRAGPYAEELEAAQREIVLQRVVILVWVAAFMMPFAIWLLAFLNAPQAMPAVFRVVMLGELAVFIIRFMVTRGAFDKHPQLAVFLLVGVTFGSVASGATTVLELWGTHFFFAYFFINLAFVTLFPLDVKWVLLVSLALDASYAGSLLIQPDAKLDRATTTNLLYLLDINILALVFNRVVSSLFFDERRARLDLHIARDALLGEMAVAQEIQTLLLPRGATLPGHDLRGEMIPADEVGGDYYDVVEATGGRRFVAIGDVSGHGVTSGLTMMMARSILVGALEADPDAPLPKLYAALNAGLRRNLARMSLRLFMTFILIEDVGGGRYRAVGSHLPPLVFRAARGIVEEITIEGVWLGMVDVIPSDLATVHEIVLDPGDHLLLYTDGIVEALSGDEMFGMGRLKDVLVRNGARTSADVVGEIFRAVRDFGGTREDDMTVLALKYQGIGKRAA